MLFERLDAPNEPTPERLGPRPPPNRARLAGARAFAGRVGGRPTADSHQRGARSCDRHMRAPRRVNEKALLFERLGAPNELMPERLGPRPPPSRALDAGARAFASPAECQHARGYFEELMSIRSPHARAESK